MPGLYGIEVLREIKKFNPDIQVIVLTGHGTEKDEVDARELGDFDFLGKPADIDLLMKRSARPTGGGSKMSEQNISQGLHRD